ncbi:extracellular calcium-sensing receptor-like [Bufo gargarizans]|uniref:extracellular calcium-sensing receptor-like n=1 Tax=Bufo gargarizans TaxID=30331 RepID=UPI001CF58A86|nr:extracellular calcium-sensing receptor-like [Bufo gargarizans]
MVYAIEEINGNDLLLPNVTLGFQLFDNCVHISRALLETFIALTGEDKAIPNYQCQKKVPLAIIGDPLSLFSMAMAAILGVYGYPQVSYAATIHSLSDRFLYPTFFRTIPSDDKQSKALAKLISFMGWKWVGLLSLNSDYGILGSQILKEELQKLGVCIAYHETFGQRTSLAKLQAISNTVVQSSAKVVILFSKDPEINKLMELLLEPQEELSHPSAQLYISVFHHLKHVYFKNRMGEEMFFDAYGNPPTDYDLLNWHKYSDGVIHFETVGRYNLRQAKENELSINITAIKWITGGSEVPSSVCSESCSPGFRKAARKGQPVCCYDCIPCSEGEISNQTDSINCFPCAAEMWPNANSTMCLPKDVEFLSYLEPLGVALSSIVIFCFFTTLSVLCMFVKYKDTAIVKANNSDLTYCLLVSLSLSFLCSLLFIGEPKRLTCLLRQTAFGVIFVICVSCIFAKTLMVIIAFRATKPGSNMRKWLGPKIPAVVIVICTCMQIFICMFWIVRCPPFPEKNLKIKAGVIIFQCNECLDVLLWAMLGYMGLLACISFIVAFLARNLPDSFNEAKWITFSMLIFLSVWISFVPAYLSTQGKFMVAVELFGIISSSAGILSCFFVPKCYIILFRPDLNTRQSLLGKSTTQKTKT